MPPPYLYFYHPPIDEGYEHLREWFAIVETQMAENADWDSCKVIPVCLNSQLGFDIANEVRRIKSQKGPVIFIHKCQRQLFERLKQKLQREVCFYWLETPKGAGCVMDSCQEALDEFNGGEPRIYKRELVAYLVLAKLERGDYRAGKAKNKGFLKIDDIPKGGFPSYVSKSDVLNAVDALFNAGFLRRKTGDGNWKYGLADMKIVQPVLNEKTLANAGKKIGKWIQKGKRVPVSDLTKNYS